MAVGRPESRFCSRSQQTVSLKDKTVCLEALRVVRFLLPLLSQLLPLKKPLEMKQEGVCSLCSNTDLLMDTDI